VNTLAYPVQSVLEGVQRLRSRGGALVNDPSSERTSTIDCQLISVPTVARDGGRCIDRFPRGS